MSAPANPLVFPIRDFNEHPGSTGITLRDWFAGQALGGVLASGAGEEDCQFLRAVIASDAYQYADAMLAERAKS